ncbi:MAG: HNH endonuclease [Acidimicrobiia bacterium]|nr:MAG: HNH endonuclease [Acidimicrobiia bacterium]
MEFGDSGRWERGRLVAAHARVNRSLVDLLDLIVELDTPESWLENSVSDMASWLQFDLGLEAKTARAWVRVAHALVELPLIRQAFWDGAVSFDEVRVLCRYATAENEGSLVALTAETPVGDLAAVIRRELAIESRRRAARQEASWVSMGWDEGLLWLRGEIYGVDGLVVEAVLRRLATQAPVDPASGVHRDPEVLTAEALVQMASESGATDGDHDRATLVVHFDAADLSSGRTSGLVGSQLIDGDELLALACDSRLQPAIDDPDGFTVGVGRTSRKIPHWLRRLLDDRDGGCRFPGCGRTRWTHAHHIIHWANEGPTNLDNLIILCGFHHRLVHRDRWRIVGNPNGEVGFLDRWGYEYRPARSQAVMADRVEQLLEHLDYYYDYRLGRLATANSPP